MIKTLIILSVILLILGCSSHNSYVKVVDDTIKHKISVEKISTRINRASGLMELQVMGENETDNYMQLRYRVVWFDKDGFEIESIAKQWRELPVYKNANFTIHIVAPNKRVADYRLFINKKD